MDNTKFDVSYAIQSAILAGSLNIFAGIGSGVSSIVGGLSRTANVTMNTIVSSRLAAGMVIIGTEAVYDLISYFIRKVF
ncbi:MAG: hypothetical protein ACI35W_07945 [Anaeroplasmataceae bacterium]